MKIVGSHVEKRGWGGKGIGGVKASGGNKNRKGTDRNVVGKGSGSDGEWRTRGLILSVMPDRHTLTADV